MKIHSESLVHHPIDQVYATYRDRLSDIAEIIPNISEIIVREREEGPAGPRVLNEWVADAELPPLIRGIVKPAWLRWFDHAQWNDAGHYVAWTLDMPAFGEQVRCSGRNSFHAQGAHTRVALTGDLQIELKRIPGVPNVMLRRMRPRVEQFVVKLIRPNLDKVNSSLERFLDAES